MKIEKRTCWLLIWHNLISTSFAKWIFYVYVNIIQLSSFSNVSQRGKKWSCRTGLNLKENTRASLKRIQITWAASFLNKLQIWRIFLGKGEIIKQWWWMVILVLKKLQMKQNPNWKRKFWHPNRFIEISSSNSAEKTTAGIYLLINKKFKLLNLPSYFIFHCFYTVTFFPVAVFFSFPLPVYKWKSVQVFV